MKFFKKTGGNIFDQFSQTALLISKCREKTFRFRAIYEMLSITGDLKCMMRARILATRLPRHYQLIVN